jgi:hypothetical protein
MTDVVLRRSVAALAASAGLLFVSGFGGPVRFVVLAAFVLLCPGIAWARLLRLGDTADTIGIGIGIGLSLVAVVGQTMALFGWWSPGTGLVALMALTAGGLAFSPPGPDEDPGGLRPLGDA